MGLTNEQIIQKATMAVADLAPGGKMNPEQAKAFIDMVVDQPTLLKQTRVERMDHDTKEIGRIGFGSRILRPAVEATALADADRSKPTTSKITLTAKKAIAEVRISYDTLQENLEKGRLQERIIRQMAERAALDLEELGLQGDTGSADTYLKLMDGYLKKAVTHVVDCTALNAGNIERPTFKRLISAVPAKFIRNIADWRFFTHRSIDLDYKELLSERSTALGDKYVVEGAKAPAYGALVEPCAMVPLTAGKTSMLFTHPQNLIFGIENDILVETDKDISAQVVIIVLTAKVAFEVEDADAMAKATNLAPKA